MKARLKVGADGVAHVYLEDGSELEQVYSVEVPEITPKDIGRRPLGIIKCWLSSVGVAGEFRQAILCPKCGEDQAQGDESAAKGMDVFARIGEAIQNIECEPTVEPTKNEPPAHAPHLEPDTIAPESVIPDASPTRSKKGRG